MNTKTKDQAEVHPGLKADEELSKGGVPAVAGTAPGTDVAVYDPGEDAGAGSENLTKDDYSIPFLYVLDAKSPQCNPPTAGGIPGAKAGSLYNTATHELFDGEKGAAFIPVYRDHNYGEWIPRNEDGSGGGFVGIRSADDPLVLELRAKHGTFGKLRTSDGHELIETFYLYGLTVTDGIGSPILQPFKSTHISAYKNFNTREMSITYVGRDGKPVRPALWAHTWRITTVFRPAKKAGQSGWYIPRLQLDKPTPIESRLKMSDPLYDQAKALYTNIKAGRVVVKQEQQQKPDEDEVPF